MDNSRRKSAPLSNWLVLAVAAISIALPAGCGSGNDAAPAGQKDLQTVSFQKPKDPGPKPFTKPADVTGSSQPFGGSGSNRVCDRDKLIRFLRANPDRMREWARVLGVSPSFGAVKNYVAKLHPVTLTRDTRITNHAFRDGRAVPFQAILQSGTAVLVDKYGTPVVRCYCGNPLRPAVYTKAARCSGCPPHYRPPPQCSYRHSENYDDAYYQSSSYSNQSYDQVFISRQGEGRYGRCYKAYPDPPVVTIVNVFRQPEPQAAPTTAPEQAAPTQTAPEQSTVTEPAPSTTAPPDSNYPCPSQPPAHPGEDYLKNCPG